MRHLKGLVMKRYRLSVNEDDSHFYMTREGGELTEAGIRGLVRQYEASSVDRLLFNVNAMRASYASAVWDRISDHEVEAGDSALARRWIANSKLLLERGLDTYALWLDECRTIGVSGWVSIRMNDVHSAEKLGHYLHSRFWREHPEYWCVPGIEKVAMLGERALDYGQAAVREHHLKLIREVFERYDFEGIELDWMRFGYHLRPGYERADAWALTEVVKEVRELADYWQGKRGHRIEVAARVASSPQDTWMLGMDAVEWGRERLVDELIAAPFWATSDMTLPMRHWRDMLGEAGKDVRLSGCLEWRIMSQPGGEVRSNHHWPGSARGFAAVMLEQGADVYLFNYMDRVARPLEGVDEEEEAALWEIYRDLGDEGAVMGKERCHVVTFKDHVPMGVARGHLLPMELDEHYRAFRVPVGVVPSSGRVWVNVGLGGEADGAGAVVAARVNGKEIGDGVDVGEVAARRYLDSQRVVRFEVPLAVMHDGDAMVEFRVEGGNVQKAVWVDVSFEPGG